MKTNFNLRYIGYVIGVISTSIVISLSLLINKTSNVLMEEKFLLEKEEIKISKVGFEINKIREVIKNENLQKITKKQAYNILVNFMEDLKKNYNATLTDIKEENFSYYTLITIDIIKNKYKLRDLLQKIINTKYPIAQVLELSTGASNSVIVVKLVQPFLKGSK